MFSSEFLNSLHFLIFLKEPRIYGGDVRRRVSQSESTLLFMNTTYDICNFNRNSQ